MNLYTFSQVLDLNISVEEFAQTLSKNFDTFFWLDTSKNTPAKQAHWSYMGSASGPNAFTFSYSLLTQEVLKNTQPYTESVPCIFNFLAAQPLPVIDNLAPSPFKGGFIGWFAYEVGSKILHPSDSTPSVPDAFLIYVDRYIAIDHKNNKVYAIAIDEAGQDRRAQEWFNEIATIKKSPENASQKSKNIDQKISFNFHTPESKYLANIERCRNYIREGDSYQICLTNALRSTLSVDAFSVYKTMRNSNPTAHSAFIKWPGGNVMCSSPEQFLQIDTTGHIETKPIKGTSKRGQTPEEDAKIKLALLNNAKERAENVMIVDLLRNDLSKVCQVNTVKVPKLLDIETYETVHQLVSTVTGQLVPQFTVYDALKALFPGGSMTGTPKKRTLEIIAELEGRNRGIYSGIIGWLGNDGACDFNIVIRTIIQTNDTITIGVGGGITYASDPEREFDEVKLKADAAIFAVVTRYFSEFKSDLFQIK